jgi:hypothetical protein
LRSNENLVLTRAIPDELARSASDFLARSRSEREEETGGKAIPFGGDAAGRGAKLLCQSSENPSKSFFVPILGAWSKSLACPVSVGGWSVGVGLPVVCVKYPQPFQFLAHFPRNSDWRRPFDLPPDSGPVSMRVVAGC